MSQSPLSPIDAKALKLERLRSLSHLLDNAIGIPGTQMRVGLDPLLGLLPFAGDYLGAIFSAYIVFEAARMGLSKASLTRMVVNLLIDTLVGTVPILGDLFDVGWKANSKNIELLESHLSSPTTSKKADLWFVVLLLSGFLLIAIAITTVTILIIGLLIKAIRS
jgi:hypothetical protein